VKSVRFGADNGLESDIAPSPKSANMRIERAGCPKEKAARGRLSILIVVDQAAINAGSGFGRWAVLADNDF
jgi:hypothetical protein